MSKDGIERQLTLNQNYNLMNWTKLKLPCTPISKGRPVLRWGEGGEMLVIDIEVFTLIKTMHPLKKADNLSANPVPYNRTWRNASRVAMSSFAQKPSNFSTVDFPPLSPQ